MKAAIPAPVNIPYGFRELENAYVPYMGICYARAMQVVARRTLKLFWDDHPQAEAPLRVWYSQITSATLSGPAQVRAMFGSADFVADNRVIFDIGGNKFRLVAHISYKYRVVLVKFVGTHAEYDKINPETV